MERLTTIEKTKLDDLYLDARNPRLGRQFSNTKPSQEEILESMDEWALDELIVSYLESGFWTNEALLVVEEELDGKCRLVVVEGNRRLAALIYLRRAFNGEEGSDEWQSLIQGKDVPEGLFDEVPYILANSREDIEAFLGFRHVTGIRQWDPEEKAQFIVKLIDERGLRYEEVMRKIGSTTPTVRVNYISYQLLLQMETLPEFVPKYAENRFSVMYLTLRKEGVREYLHIDIMADPEIAKKPVPDEHKENLGKFALWLFGNDDQPPLFEDSRHAEKFNTILKSPEARQYLESRKRPDFDKAYQLAVGDEPEILKLITEANDNIKISLSYIHRYRNSQDMQKAVENLSIDFRELLTKFPSIEEQFFKEE